jgi:methylthioribose-1-phosphate isomerase
MNSLKWRDGRLSILDQTKLPHEEIYISTSDFREVAKAISELKVRGAPAIGIAAAYGMVLAAQGIKADTVDDFLPQLRDIASFFLHTRPTTMNLSRALSRMEEAARESKNISTICESLLAEARRIQKEEEKAIELISSFGASLISNGSTILTHCNAGPLATAGALGTILSAVKEGKKISVFATETRPLLQGARLTTLELMQENVDTILICDSSAGYFMQQGGIDMVIVGADRIALNGDVANKIGTYTLAVLAHENHIPFYVAAPISTLDPKASSGEEILIEERDSTEVTNIGGVEVAPQGVRVKNPAFDVTPHEYISAIITDKGIICEPYELNLRESYD